MRKPVHFSAALVWVLTVACGEGQPVAPRPSFSVTSGTLSVVITAPGDLRDPENPTTQTLPVKATASGGSGPYKFRWLRRICNTGPSGNYCEPTYAAVFDAITTVGSTSSFNHKFLLSDYKTWFVVEVQETAAGGKSGADSVLVLGPGNGFVSHTGGSIYFTCDLGPNYPLNDPATGTDYRRNPCTGAYEPKN